MGFTPYAFQVEDHERIVRQKSGLIGSEMGVGKTHQAIMLDEDWYNKATPRPTLIVAPLNTFTSWQEKYGDQSPQTDVTVIDRKNRDKFITQIRRRQGDVFLMHWDALRLMPELQQFEFNLITADEVHRASNRKAQATACLKKLHTAHKLGMSGTATGDKVEGLWSILNWLWPSTYKSYWKFRKAYVLEELVEKYPGDKTGYSKIIGPNLQNLPFLMEQMAPWYVRHLKKQACCEHHPEGVMPWLMDKTYDKIWVDLSPTQRRVYDQMRDKMVAWVNEHEDSPLVASVVVAQLVRLSQMALGTPVVLDDGKVRLTEPSSKLDAVTERLKDNPDQKFVVASSSKQICYLAQEKWNKQGIGSFVLSGDTPQSQRDRMVQDFRDGGNQVFIGVIAAMAEGIDGLQEASNTMIFLDRSWSTIKNMQCEDRLHRDGQKDAVNIIDVMARNTVDLGRHTKLGKKWEDIKIILGDGYNTRTGD